MSYTDQKLNEANISNEWATPGVTQLGTLATLKLLKQTKDIAQGTDNLAKIAQEEIKYLEAAMGAIASNPGLASKFGSGFDGVQELAGIIKARQSQRVFEDVLKDVLDKADGDANNKSTLGKFDLDKAKKRQNYIV
jgi:hypothetical protein